MTSQNTNSNKTKQQKIVNPVETQDIIPTEETIPPIKKLIICVYGQRNKQNYNILPTQSKIFQLGNGKNIIKKK